jgi:hypothetical protein
MKHIGDNEIGVVEANSVKMSKKRAYINYEAQT